MKVITYPIEYRYGDTIRIKFFQDLHIGSPLFDKTGFKNFISDETPVKEFYPSTEDGIVDLLYCVKENCLYHYNSKHNNYNIDIKKVKVKSQFQKVR